jgi:hypothetical protein
VAQVAVMVGPARLARWFLAYGHAAITNTAITQM